MVKAKPATAWAAESEIAGLITTRTNLQARQSALAGAGGGASILPTHQRSAHRRRQGPWPLKTYTGGRGPRCS